ncbi:hypothetical protein MmiEs2_04980 [Methanimicrococcus stummii]|uniref:C2H2-type domain-containing protein n=1 Tax=Methanimicrococcus stummii TaxID=3028294 RepID=A0AA97A7Q0_9EURY|nr:hypothetical protein [Methanimicrococcus sp. Es2]WNY28313.1 hypothetical protein MmiEs2_04980 [Methanimicrococcus sp. Es2]
MTDEPKKKRFVCDLCEKEFASKQRLNYHYEQKVCGDPNEMPEPPEPKPTPNDTPKEDDFEQKATAHLKKLGLYKEQKEDLDPTVYKCGSCGHKQETKYKHCPSCGDVNEWD